jgi:hypothetical protein
LAQLSHFYLALLLIFIGLFEQPDHECGNKRSEGLIVEGVDDLRNPHYFGENRRLEKIKEGRGMNILRTQLVDVGVDLRGRGGTVSLNMDIASMEGSILWMRA